MKAESSSVGTWLDTATTRIAAALPLEKREARLDARVLAAHAWQVSPTWLIAHDTDALTPAQTHSASTLLEQRLTGVPVAYLTGQREFFGRTFAITADVLIPRPDTELLVELALARIPPDRPVDVLDLGTGSGCIAITLALERPQARVVAVDRAAAALTLAKRNARQFDARVEFLNSDWFSALSGRRFHLIVSNPPYIAEADPHLAEGDVRFEPRSALTAGPEGFADLHYLTEHAQHHLKPAGQVLLEHGYQQASGVCGQLAATGWTNVQSWPDLAGHLRVSGGTLSE